MRIDYSHLAANAKKAKKARPASLHFPAGGGAFQSSSHEDLSGRDRRCVSVILDDDDDDDTMDKNDVWDTDYFGPLMNRDYLINQLPADDALRHIRVDNQSEADGVRPISEQLF